MLVSSSPPNIRVINYKRIKYLSFEKNLTNFKVSTIRDPRIAYVADKGNHCIRLNWFESILIKVPKFLVYHPIRKNWSWGWLTNVLSQ